MISLRRNDVDELIAESAKLRGDLLAASDRLAAFAARLQDQVDKIDEREAEDGND